MANFLPPPPPPWRALSPAPPPWWALSPPPPPSPWWALSPPPPPPWWARSPPPPWRYTSYTDDSSSTSGAMIAAVCIFVAMFVLAVLVSICSIAGRQRAPPSVPAEAAEPRDNDDEEQQLRGAGAGQSDDCRRPRPAGPTTATLPSFTYTLSLKHNVTSDDDAAACSVCLGALEVGETVRLLPVCMHLYHVECIDPWLVAHSTCPICRSGTMDKGPRLPPV